MSSPRIRRRLVIAELSDQEHDDCQLATTTTTTAVSLHQARSSPPPPVPNKKNSSRTFFKSTSSMHRLSSRFMARRKRRQKLHSCSDEDSILKDAPVRNMYQKSPRKQASEKLLSSPNTVATCKQQAAFARDTKPSAKDWREAPMDKNDSSCEISESSPEYRSSHCWGCNVLVRGDECLYALHVHPLLQIPVCCICADAVLHVEQDEQGESCSACATEECGTLLLCDECPRGFCVECVSKAYGGKLKVQQLLAADESEKWACLVCCLPEELKALKVKAKNGSDTEQVTVEQLLEELEALENELEECEESEDHEATQRELIAREFSTLRSEEQQERVEEELQLWIDQWRDHQYRLRDRVASVQEELEHLQVSLSSFYSSFQHYRESLGGNPGSMEEDPLWKASADRELDQLGKLEYKPADPNVYQQDLEEGDYDLEIEDLLTGDDQVLHDLKERLQWSAMKGTIDEATVERCRKREDEILKGTGISIKKVDNENDTTETVMERQRTARRSGESKSLVRQDAFELCTTPESREGPKKRIRLTPSTVSQLESLQKSVSRRNRRTAAKSAQSTVEGSQSSPAEDVEAKTTAHRSRGDMFEASDVVLSDGNALHGRRCVSIAEPLAAVLKEHQVEGIKFMWRNACPDLGYIDQKSYLDSDEGEVGGCILAHNMGLGKSLQVIAFLHMLLNHPSLEVVEGTLGQPKRLVRRALLVVPVNTLANWECEFDKWLDDLYPVTVVFNLNSEDKKSQRESIIRRWARNGGVLLVSDRLYTKVCSVLVNVVSRGSATSPVMKKLEDLCDVVVLDEAHTMLKNLDSKTYKALYTISTVRRVVLSGTPLQNSLREYFRMASWVRPGCLGTESCFERTYEKPIMDGLASDSTKDQVISQVRLCQKLAGIMEPFMHRRDRSVLFQVLPPMQQVVLHVRQSKTQARLYRAFKKKFPVDENFFKYLQAVRPLHNHPACLLMTSRFSQHVSSPFANSLNMTDDAGSKPERYTKTTSAVLATASHFSMASQKETWWNGVVARMGVQKLKDVENGFKIVLLLQILAHADALGDKVVCFSQCLRTLDYIEEVLNHADWGRFVENCTSFSSGEKLGSWRKNDQYLRIDGAVSAFDRGDMIASFQSKEVPSDATVLESTSSRLFLISIQAGSLGINLTAANRVVIFDNHWNPSVTEQALFRCYRYGQTKPVYVYRFITEGSIEEKIYSRSVNKSGLAARIVDQQHPERFFTERELSEVKAMNQWVQCDHCDKWRMLPPEDDVENLPDAWFCAMNEFDEQNNTCDAEERDEQWYARNTEWLHQSTEGQPDGLQTALPNPTAVSVDTESEAKKLQSISRDEILGSLLEMGGTEPTKLNSSSGTRTQSSVISKLHFHETLLEESRADLDLEASREDDSFRSHGDRVGSSEKQNVLEEANAIVADISAPNDNNVEAGDPVASRTVTEVSKPRQSMGELHVEKPVLSTAHPAPSADESHLSQSSDSRLVVCGKSPSPRKGCPWSSTRRTKRSTRKVVFSTYEETGPRESLGDRGGYPRPGSLGKTTSPVESHFAKRKSSLISTESQHASRFTSSRKWPVSGVAFCKQEVSQPRKKSSQEKPSMFDALLLSSSSDDDDSELVAEPLALSPETDPQIADRVDESKKSRKSGATSDEAIELLD